MSIWKRKDGVFQFSFTIERRRFVGSTKERDKRAAQSFERAAKERAFAELKLLKETQGRAGPMSVEIAFVRFWAEVGAHYNGNWRQTVWAALRWLAAELGPATPLREIDTNRIALIIAKRRADVGNTTVNRTVTELLRTIMRRARDLWEQEVSRIAWRDLMLKEPQERVRELRDHEEPKLVAEIRADYLPPIRLALLLGLRKREVVDLRWSAIDWTARTITVRGKGDKVRLVPLTDGARAILSPLLGQHDEAVFTYCAGANNPHLGLIQGERYPITYSGLSSMWRRRGPAKAGIADFRFHDTRHTAATRLLRQTGNLRLAQKLLGHEDIATTSRYAHVTDEDLRKGLDAVEQSAPAVKPAGKPVSKPKRA